MNQAGTLAVRTESQKVLFEKELMGQISDGKWENARPMSHWEAWSDAKVIVDPTNLGRDFYAVKDNYNFTDALLLSIVGERMIEAVREHCGLPNYGARELKSDLIQLKQIVRMRRAYPKAETYVDYDGRTRSTDEAEA